MNWNARIQYAGLAVIELARQYRTDSPVQIRGIAERLQIPSRFLVQILIQLKSSGLVASTRGASGGYQLTRPPQSITILDLITAVESVSEPTVEAASAERVVLAEVAAEAQRAYRDVLRQITLADVLERVGGKNDPMYFI